MGAAEDILDTLADLVAVRVAERLGSKAHASEFVDQASCGFDRKTFVRAARAGEFVASKVGRRWIARRCDVAAWIDALRPKLSVANETDNLDALRARMGLKVRHAS